MSFTTVDQVHGSISIPAKLTCIIDNSVFQRLRNIKQLGITEQIYPSARHNRFEHCLGVCYLAGELLDCLKKKDPKINFTETDKLCVQIAALCHDLGHGPFSHLFEAFITKIRPNKKWEHEGASQQLIDMLKVDERVRTALQLAEIDWTFIKECIHFGPGHASIASEVEWKEKGPKGRPWSKAYLYDILSNEMDGFDVDRFDYFMRDSKVCRVDVPFGMDSVKRLFANCCVLNDKDNGGRPRICYAEKVASILSDAGTTRYKMHDRVYQHHTVKAIESMLIDIMIYANMHLQFRGKDRKAVYLSDTVDDMAAFLNVNDGLLTMLDASTSEDKDLLKAQHLYTRIKTRQLYHYLGEARVMDNVCTDKKEMETFCANIKAEFSRRTGIRGDDVVIEVKHLHAGLKGENPIIRALFYDNKQLRDDRDRVVPYRLEHMPATPGGLQTRLLMVFLKCRPAVHEERSLFDHFKAIAEQNQLQNTRSSRKRSGSGTLAENRRSVTPRENRARGSTSSINAAKKSLNFNSS